MAVVGAVTITNEKAHDLEKVSWNFTADASGNASGVVSNVTSGLIEHMVFTPLSPAPATTGVFTIVDADGADTLAGSGTMNGATQVGRESEGPDVTHLGCVVFSTLELKVSGAGNGGKGAVHTYLRQPKNTIG